MIKKSTSLGDNNIILYHVTGRHIRAVHTGAEARTRSHWRVHTSMVTCTTNSLLLSTIPHIIRGQY